MLYTLAGRSSSYTAWQAPIRRGHWRESRPPLGARGAGTQIASPEADFETSPTNRRPHASAVSRGLGDIASASVGGFFQAVGEFVQSRGVSADILLERSDGLVDLRERRIQGVQQRR